MTTRQLSFDLNAVTALGPNDPDDGDAGRQQRGVAIAALTRIEKNRLGYKIPSASGPAFSCPIWYSASVSRSTGP